MAKRYLAEKGVKFTEYDVSVDREAAGEMIRLTGQMGVPVIVVDKKVILGFDRSALDNLLVNRQNGHKVVFGISVADASKIARESGLADIYGAYVGSVHPGSIGERAGLLAGDIITKINTRTIENADDVESELSGISTGSTIKITFIRGQKVLNTEVKL